MMQVLSVLQGWYGWYQTHKEPLELIALLFTFLGMYLAVRSISDGRKMLKDLGSVFDHLTTRGLGPYPSYTDEIERLIGEARSNVIIACDFPGYGVWPGGSTVRLGPTIGSTPRTR